MKVVQMWLRVLLFVWLNVGAARAQEVAEGVGGSMRLWENRWDRPWESLRVAEPFSLGVTLGRGTGSLATQRWHSLRLSQPEHLRKKEVEYYALATLQVPLQSLFLSPAGADESAGDTGEEHGGATTSVKPVDRMSVEIAQLEPRANISEQDSRDAQEDFLALVRVLLVKVNESQDAGERRLASLRRRSRSAGWVPELRLRGVYGFDRSTSSEDTLGVLPGETTVRGTQDSLLEARLTFRLDRLVFGDGEAGIERQLMQAQERRNKREQRALELLNDFRAGEVALRDPTLLAEELLAARLKADRALAELHVLTSGWFRGRQTMGELGLRIVAPPDSRSEDVADSAQPEEEAKPESSP